jgi:hypothetical protein
MHEPQKPLSAEDLRFIDEAALYLEEPRFLMKVANLVGKPAEWALTVLPKKAHALVSDATQSALNGALYVGVRSLTSHRILAAGPRVHVTLTAIAGAVGGLFGLFGAAVEIPLTTTLMMRSIAQIAKGNGSDLADPETLMQCLSVFSFGAPNLEAMESAFLSARFALAEEVKRAAAFVAGRTAEGIATAVKNGAAPALVNLLNKIAARFQIQVTEKLTAEAIPIAGALGGALINAAFTDHFNRVAEFHFGIVRLERQSGQDVVQAAYLKAVERAKQRRRPNDPNAGST